MKLASMSIDPISIFGWELDKIVNEEWRTLCAMALYKIPDYFWTVPASTSSKYHPRTSLGIGGLVRHTKAAFLVAENLFTNSTYAPFTDAEKDIIRIAIVLHDSFKQGMTDSGHTASDHPMLVRSLFNVFEPEELECVWGSICDCIETHMGQWDTDKEGVVILPRPFTEMQKFVHLCDFLSSRRDIEVDVYRREAPDKGEADWKDGKATEGQIKYISSLLQKIIPLGLTEIPYSSVPLENLTKGLASDIIVEYKRLLGFKDR